MNVTLPLIAHSLLLSSVMISPLVGLVRLPLDSSSVVKSRQSSLTTSFWGESELRWTAKTCYWVKPGRHIRLRPSVVTGLSNTAPKEWFRILYIYLCYFSTCSAYVLSHLRGTYGVLQEPWCLSSGTFILPQSIHRQMTRPLLNNFIGDTGLKEIWHTSRT